MFAAENGHDQTACVLLSHGADVNTLTRGNETALMRAALQPYTGAVTDLLISHGAAVYVRDEAAVYETPSLITGDEKSSVLAKAKQDQVRRYHQEMYAHSLLDICALPHPVGGNIKVFNVIKLAA
jgi:ankyrin repeat protein